GQDQVHEAAGDEASGEEPSQWIERIERESRDAGGSPTAAVGPKREQEPGERVEAGLEVAEHGGVAFSRSRNRGGDPRIQQRAARQLGARRPGIGDPRSEEHTSELQSRENLV